MNIIMLYGAPGVGKYTIGKLVAKKLKYEFIHNHMLVNPVLDIFKPKKGKAEPFFRVAKEFRLSVMKECIRQGKDVVTTYAYGVELARGAKPNNKVLSEITEILEKEGAKCTFVHITCNHEKQLERIADESREQHKKLRNPKTLKKIMSVVDCVAPITFTESIEIDTSDLSPLQSAKKIVSDIQKSKK